MNWALRCGPDKHPDDLFKFIIAPLQMPGQFVKVHYRRCAR